MSNDIDKALDTQIDEILTELADEHFYEGAELGGDDYATDGYEAHTSEAKAKLKTLLNEAMIEAVIEEIEHYFNTPGAVLTERLVDLKDSLREGKDI